MQILQFSENGKKKTSIDEFGDLDYSERFSAALKKEEQSELLVPPKLPFSWKCVQNVAEVTAEIGTVRIIKQEASRLFVLVIYGLAVE